MSRGVHGSVRTVWSFHTLRDPGFGCKQTPKQTKYKQLQKLGLSTLGLRRFGLVTVMPGLAISFPSTWNPDPNGTTNVTHTWFGVLGLGSGFCGFSGSCGDPGARTAAKRSCILHIQLLKATLRHGIHGFFLYSALRVGTVGWQDVLKGTMQLLFRPWDQKTSSWEQQS